MFFIRLCESQVLFSFYEQKSVQTTSIKNLLLMLMLQLNLPAHPSVPRASVHVGDDQGSQARAAPPGDTIQAAAGGQAGGPALHGGAH